MRLSDREARALGDVVGSFLGGRPGSLFLYGSRTRDDLRGGDVDLVVVSPSEEVVADLRRNRHRLLGALKRSIGDRRIDLSVASEQERARDPFWQNALRDAIPLLS